MELRNGEVFSNTCVEISQETTFARCSFYRCAFQDATNSGAKFLQCQFMECEGLPAKSLAAYCCFMNSAGGQSIDVGSFDEVIGD